MHFSVQNFIEQCRFHKKISRLNFYIEIKIFLLILRFLSLLAIIKLFWKSRFKNYASCTQESFCKSHSNHFYFLNELSWCVMQCTHTLSYARVTSLRKIKVDFSRKLIFFTNTFESSFNPRFLENFMYFFISRFSYNQNLDKIHSDHFNFFVVEVLSSISLVSMMNL